jgi:drug/metabolite transporter (DMT)-like permease
MATAILVPAALVIERPWTMSPSLASVMAIVALAVFSTGFAFVIYFRLLAVLGSISTGSQAYLRIGIGVGLGALFLGERPSVHVLLGLVLVIAAVAAMTWSPRGTR